MPKQVSIIGNLQVLRGVAALSVVFYHTDFRLFGDAHTDLSGVAAFFVISGFIMCYISQRDPDLFFIKRLLRIVPLYWICTGALILLTFNIALLRPWRWPPDFIPHVVRSLLFVEPSPVLGVGWSLDYEMAFYLIFAMSLWMQRRLAPLIASGILVALNNLAALGCEHSVCTWAANGYVKFFVFGIGLYYLAGAAFQSLPKVPTIALAAVVILFCYGLQLGLFAPTEWQADAIPVALVASALALSAVGADAKWRPLILLGDASYSIYLTHTIFMAFLWMLPRTDVMASAKSNPIVMLLIVGICLSIGLCIHLCVEKPVGRIIRDRMLRKETREARAAVAGSSNDL